MFYIVPFYFSNKILCIITYITDIWMSILKFRSHRIVHVQTASIHKHLFYQKVCGSVSYIFVYLCVQLPYDNRNLS